MDELPPKEMFLQSVKRCVANEDFIGDFYKRFLDSSDEVKKKFRFTDFEKQNQMLRRSLELCVGATSGQPEALAEMRDRAKTHDRDHLNIEPAMYDLWLDAMIATAGDYDPEWNDAIEAAWRKILGYVVQYMIRKY